NMLVKPLSDKWYMSDEEVARLQAKSAAADAGPTGSFGIGRGGFDGKALAAWAIVGIPILWGVWITLQKTAALF
ncbi:MAG: MFS transporter, partial [Nitratireductor sp.]